MNRAAKKLLMAALVGVVGMAFRVSWNALRDVAHAVGADAAAATLYPFVVDGLMALALVATLALTGRDRQFALRVLAAYTLASLTLNYVHGLDPAMRTGQSLQLADRAPANYVLVLLATSLPVGAIFFGSDLVAKVLHHHPEPAAPAAAPIPPATSYEDGRTTGPRAEPVRPAPDAGERTDEPTPERTETIRPPRKPARSTRTAARLTRARQAAEQAYADSLDAGSPIGPAALGREFGFSEGWGRKRIKAVQARRRKAAADRLPITTDRGEKQAVGAGTAG